LYYISNKLIYWVVKKEEQKMKIKEFFKLSWKKLWIIIISWFVAVLLHNLVYALLYNYFQATGGDEPFFFIIAGIIIPLYFLIVVIYTAFIVIKNKKEKKRLKPLIISIIILLILFFIMFVLPQLRNPG